MNDEFADLVEAEARRVWQEDMPPRLRTKLSCLMGIMAMYGRNPAQFLTAAAESRDEAKGQSAMSQGGLGSGRIRRAA